MQDNIEYLLIYAKNKSAFNINEVPVIEQELMSYIKEYKDTGKSWKYTSVLVRIDDGEFIKKFETGNSGIVKLYKHSNYEMCSIKKIADEQYNGDIKKAYYNNIDRVFRTTNAQTSIRTQVIEETREFNNEGLFSIEYTPIKGRNAGVLVKNYYKDTNLIAWLKSVTKISSDRIIKIDNMGNLWTDIQYNNLTKEGGVKFPNGKKPELLVKRVLSMLSRNGDIILDSFLGSGTTCAVAQKMGRRYIGIEMGDHAYTHCKTRMDKVVSGEDKGGITKEMNWQGGGAYKFYELAPTLINEDAYGEKVINKDYDADMLASAVALHEGYTYEPDGNVFWKQSRGSEKSFLFVTTKFVSKEYVETIKDSMSDGEFLIIACSAFENGADKIYAEIKIKKIPQMLLERCEFGRDNYELNIVHPPVYEDEEDFDDE